jgi:hypothetical protein
MHRKVEFREFRLWSFSALFILLYHTDGSRKTVWFGSGQQYLPFFGLHVRHKCLNKEGMNGKYIYIMKGEIVKLQLRLISGT